MYIEINVTQSIWFLHTRICCVGEGDEGERDEGERDGGRDRAFQQQKWNESDI